MREREIPKTRPSGASEPEDGAASRPLSRIDREETKQRKPAPDSVEWWRDVAQGLGIRCFDMTRALDAAWQDIHDWIRFGRDLRAKVENPNFSPLTPTEAGIAKSESVLRQISEASKGELGTAPTIREAFRAGFLAHPEPEAEVFTWSFDPEGFNIAADREQSAWDAYVKTKRPLTPKVDLCWWCGKDCAVGAHSMEFGCNGKGRNG